VDGYDDNGIDAILFEKNQNILWLVQSKWIEKGNGEPETGDTAKFTNGIRDLVNNELDRFNSKVNAKETDIAEALDNAAVRIGIVIAYTGPTLVQSVSSLPSHPLRYDVCLPCCA